MNKLIITRWDRGILTALQADGEIVQLSVDSLCDLPVLGNIYIGKVKNIVKNINAAFVEFENGRMGYYSLTENQEHIFAKPHSGQTLKAGDEIVVQISRDAVKTKAPVLTSNLSFPGKYCVLTLGKNVIGFSSKIKDNEWKQRIKEQLSGRWNGTGGIIVRTNAEGVEAEVIQKELDALFAAAGRVLSEAAFRTCYSLVYRSVPPYISEIRGLNSTLLEEIITDDKQIMEELESYLSCFQPEDLCKLSFYEDKLLSLKKLYSLETAMEHALSKRVWLKSGGYLVIEPTEALVVIDVNTGKYSEKKDLRTTILKTNLEAAFELMKQLRLRNLSGIIIVDFIDMDQEEDRLQLLNCLEDLASKDPIKTTVVDITKLNLVELTRKKVRKPLYEQASFTKGE